MREYPGGERRLPYPVGWQRALLFESVAQELWHAGLNASEPVRECLEPMRWIQPPSPADDLADTGAALGQLYLAARCYGMNAAQTAELIAICERVGCSARHGSILTAHGLQRQHEIEELDALYTRPAAKRARAETEE